MRSQGTGGAHLALRVPLAVTHMQARLWSQQAAPAAEAPCSKGKGCSHHELAVQNCNMQHFPSLEGSEWFTNTSTPRPHSAVVGSISYHLHGSDGKH